MAIAAEVKPTKNRNYVLSDQVCVVIAITVIIALLTLNDGWKFTSRTTCCSVNTFSLFSYILLGCVLLGLLHRAVAYHGKFSLFFPLE